MIQRDVFKEEELRGFNIFGYSKTNGRHQMILDSILPLCLFFSFLSLFNLLVSLNVNFEGLNLSSFFYLFIYFFLKFKGL